MTEVATTIPASSTEEGAHSEKVLFVVGVSCPPWQVQLGAPRVVFGRERDCDVVLQDGQASRQHAEITRVGPVQVLRDLESMNGTFLNGQRIREAPLHDSDVLRIGDWLGVVLELDADQPRDLDFREQARGLFGSARLSLALAPLRIAARSQLPIIVEGETGTGKELVARAVHDWSGHSGPFVAVNCAALPDALAEAELFGYRRGAFTGAERPSPGYLRSADGGTLLLDEVCELSLSTQARLLRVLEQREVVPLGESKPVPIDVRVVAAAQESLQHAVNERRFRADLLARLDGLTVRIPPLRERLEDVPRLADHFMREMLGARALQLTVRCANALCLYDWPSNVRELRWLSRRLAVLHAHEVELDVRHLPEHVRASRAGTASQTETPAEPTSELEQLLAALRRHGGNVTRAARAVGISRMRAYRLMNAAPDVNVNDFRGDPRSDV